MWAQLSHPGHAESFVHLGEDYAPLRQLVEALAQRSYANSVFAFKSMYSFCLTSAATYQDSDGHDTIGISYNPSSGVFHVHYAEWLSPTRNPRSRVVADRSCAWPEILEVIDRYVIRLLMSASHCSVVSDPRTGF